MNEARSATRVASRTSNEGTEESSRRVLFALGLAACAMVASGTVAILDHVAGDVASFEGMDLTTLVFAVWGVGIGVGAAGVAGGLWLRARERSRFSPGLTVSVVAGSLALAGAVFADLLQGALVFLPSIWGAEPDWITHPWGYGLVLAAGGPVLIVGAAAWPARATAGLFGLLFALHVLGAAIYASVADATIRGLDGYIGWPVLLALLAYGPPVAARKTPAASARLKGWARVVVAAWLLAAGLAAIDVATKAFLLDWLG